jgi:hypothetical protein
MIRQKRKEKKKTKEKHRKVVVVAGAGASMLVVAKYVLHASRKENPSKQIPEFVPVGMVVSMEADRHRPPFFSPTYQRSSFQPANGSFSGPVCRPPAAEEPPII